MWQNHNGNVGCWGISIPDFLFHLFFVGCPPALKAVSLKAPNWRFPFWRFYITVHILTKAIGGLGSIWVIWKRNYYGKNGKSFSRSLGKKIQYQFSWCGPLSIWTNINKEDNVFLATTKEHPNYGWFLAKKRGIMQLWENIKHCSDDRRRVVWCRRLYGH